MERLKSHPLILSDRHLYYTKGAIQSDEIALLPSSDHPNYRLWHNYARFAPQRGWLVTHILKGYTTLPGRRILDVGCGEGGTAVALARHGAKVTAIDINPNRIQKLKNNQCLQNPDITWRVMIAQNLEFDNQSFDIVVLQDVLEHTPDPAKVIQEAARVLKSGGLVYLSTPNRFSVLNLISDPHWNLPLVAVLPRRGVAFAVRKIFRREQNPRRDLAALLSLPGLRQLLKNNNLRIQLVNRQVAQAMLKHPPSVVCSDVHLRLVSIIKRAHLEDLILTIVNDNWGIFNFVLNPTWYLIGQRL